MLGWGIADVAGAFSGVIAISLYSKLIGSRRQVIAEKHYYVSYYNHVHYISSNTNSILRIKQAANKYGIEIITCIFFIHVYRGRGWEL